jgi:DNA processing protein
VTDAPEVLELVGRVGRDLAPERVVEPREGDGLDPVLRRALDALPVRRPAPVDSIARAAGLSVPEVRAALGRLELAGLAVVADGSWRRSAWRSTRGT